MYSTEQILFELANLCSNFVDSWQIDAYKLLQCNLSSKLTVSDHFDSILILWHHFLTGIMNAKLLSFVRYVNQITNTCVNMARE